MLVVYIIAVMLPLSYAAKGGRNQVHNAATRPIRLLSPAQATWMAGGLRTLLIFSAALIITGCGNGQSSRTNTSADDNLLVGAWRAKIIFRSGPLAGLKDLEFLYSYNSGGTMTESSNYDEAANSSPPAYGIWKRVTPQTFQTKYVFYTTKAPGPGNGAPNSDWWPAGHGVLTETITLSADGQTYTSAVRMDTYDNRGKVVAGGGGEGTGAGMRIVF